MRAPPFHWQAADNSTSFRIVKLSRWPKKEYREVIAKGPLSTNAQQTQMVKNVGARIQKAVEKYLAEKNLSDQLAGFNWEFNLIDDPKTVNAWCMPGGGLLSYRHHADL